MMRKAAIFTALAGCALSVLAADEATTPEVVLPTALTWTSPPNNPALQGAWVLGAEKKPGPYILRVKLAAGGKIAPHTHPDERNSTVLSGTVYVGFGKTFDAAKMVAIPPGGVYVAPANVPHFVWAKDGEVVYQEAGVAPTATNYAGS
jgi:quercetin dioxygenase-like cupin family protein